MKLLPKMLADEDELDRQPPEAEAEADWARRPAERTAGPRSRWVLFVAIGALVPRLTYLFVFSNPENAGQGFTDAYHHWQIAYLTKEIGLSQGRLWDMRGWEYFWGLLHPVLMNGLFFATGSIDIVLARLLSMAFGSIAVVLIFLLTHRYWGMQVAVAAAAFAALSPVAVFNDDAGMAEPIATALVLLGIWWAPRRGFLAGAAWGFAAMARIEAWLFGAGLVAAWLLGRRTSRMRWDVILGWLLVMGAYFKFLLDKTGNPIYPLYVNFQFAVLGAGTGAKLTHDQTLLWIPLGVAVLVLVAGLVWSLWKQPASYVLLSYGFGYSALSFATYLRYVSEWKERRFEFPVDFAAILLIVLVLRVLPQRGLLMGAPGWAAVVAGLFAVQLLWIPIQSAYMNTEPAFRNDVQLARSIGDVYNQPAYRGGVLNMSGDEPTLLYLFAHDEGIAGDHITSQFYDPFYYLRPGFHYSDHKAVVGRLLQCWLWNTRTRLILLSPPGPFSPSVADYKAFIADNPQWFSQTSAAPRNGWEILGVQVPPASPEECAQAARDAVS